MKRVILVAAFISTGAMAQSFDLDTTFKSPGLAQRPTAILPVAPISDRGPTTVWQSGNYTYIDEPRGQTTVFQAGNFTYINHPNGQMNTCQTIGKFTYCN